MIHRISFSVAFLCLLVVSGPHAQNLLEGPESVVFDGANNRYLVSNYNGGTIVQIDQNGDQSYFATGWAHCLGLQIAGNKLYATIEDGVYPSGPDYLIGFDLASGEIVTSLAISSSACLDGITWDGGEFLYVVDVSGRILKVDIAAQTYSTLVASGLAPLPQDVVYDGANNRLLVARWSATDPILAIDLSDLSRTSALAAAPTYLDGICMRDDGMVFLSSHYSPGMIFMWNGQYDGLALPISWPHHIAAGCCYNAQDDVLAVAVQGDNTVVFIPLGDPDGDEILSVWDNCPDDYNPDQSDFDQDGEGDLCDLCTDFDDDGSGDPGFSTNTCETDNCPAIPNPYQGDFDSDTVGDECDNCIFAYNPGQADTNQDGIGDACEGCCQLRVGDANGLGGDEPTIGDVSVMIDAKFITGTCEGILDCFTEADVNQSGRNSPDCDDITIGDISTLIDYLFITGQPLGLAECL